MLLNNQEIKEEIKKYWKIGEKNYNNLKPMGHSKSSYNRDVNRDTILPKGGKKSLNTLNLHLKPTREKNKKPLNWEEGKKSWKSKQK